MELSAVAFVDTKILHWEILSVYYLWKISVLFVENLSRFVENPIHNQQIMENLQFLFVDTSRSRNPEKSWEKTLTNLQMAWLMVLDPFMIPQKKIGALPLKIQKRTYLLLVGGWATPLKNMSSSVGMMTFPIYGKIKAMFQTTKQIGILRSCWMQDSLILIPGCSPLWNLEQWSMSNAWPRKPHGPQRRSSPRTQRITLLQISAVSDWLRNCTTNGAVLLFFSGYISGSKFRPTSGVIIIMFIHIYTINLYPFVTTFLHQRSVSTSDLSGKLWIPAGFFGCGDNDLSSRIGIVLGQDLSQPKIWGSSQGGD